MFSHHYTIPIALPYPVYFILMFYINTTTFPPFLFYLMFMSLLSYLYLQGLLKFV